MKRTITAIAILLFVTGWASAQTSFPMISHTHPVAIQRGKTTEVLVDGTQNFFGARQVLFEGKGLKAEIVSQDPPATMPPAPPMVRSVKLKITVDADAALGVRDYRIATLLGISSVGQLVVVDDSVVVENAANNITSQAQAIQLPCVIAGKIEAVEDVDFYKFEGKEGETVTFELKCARLQDRIHDLQKHAKPMLTLFDGTGRELAANDTFFFADPMLSTTLPKTGPYYVQVRESTYDGDARWVYALLATTRPYASHVVPLAGNPGQTIEVEPVGSARKLQPKVAVTLPREPGVHTLPLKIGDQTTYPVTMIVTPLPAVLEQAGSDTPEKATRFTIPAALNGRIAKRREMDHFVFAGKKGQQVRLELKARRFGTPLNSSLHGVLEVLNTKGSVVASNDTSHGQEAALVFAIAADGDYVVRVRDLNSKGGDSFVYCVEAELAQPDFTVKCDPDKAMIGPGTSQAWYVQINRINGMTGPVKVEVRGLPAGVAASPLTIPAAMKEGLVVLTAAADAAQGASNVEIVGSATIQRDGKEEALTRRATPIEEIYSPGGGRARFDVNLQSVAVTNTSDIVKVDVTPNTIRLKPGDEVKLDVTLTRRPDFDKNVTLDVMLAHLGGVFANPLPPGVTVVPGKSKTLLGTGSKGHIVLKAAPTAEPVENVPISVVANVAINFVVKVAYSSPPLPVTVTKK